MSWSHGSWIYNYLCNQYLSPLPTQATKHYLIKFVNDLRQVGGFLRVLRFPPSIKLTATIYLLTEILLKVALETITQTYCLIVGVYWLIVGNVHLYIFICILCLYYIPRSVYELFLNSLTHVTITCVTRGAHNDIQYILMMGKTDKTHVYIKKVTISYNTLYIDYYI